MLTHENIWFAIDRLAASFGYSPSGLAKQAGLDSTSFNKSKRINPDGKPRWPSTESISRILAATGASMSDFLSLIDVGNDHHANPLSRREQAKIPVIGFAQAGEAGYFDAEGYPDGDAWDEVQFPSADAGRHDTAYALEISGDSMLPLYRNGDVIVVSPDSTLKRGDRVVVKTTRGEIMAKELRRNNDTKIELRSLNQAHEDIHLTPKDIVWMARILWVSQ